MWASLVDGERMPQPSSLSSLTAAEELGHLLGRFMTLNHHSDNTTSSNFKLKSRAP